MIAKFASSRSDNSNQSRWDATCSQPAGRTCSGISRQRPLRVILLLIVSFCLLVPNLRAQNEAEAPGKEESPFPQRVKVPKEILDGGHEWLNAAGPISIPDLHGKIVIFDFWTYCCINCMHILPELKAIEHKYPNEVVVIGVHSAKFDNEKETENIRRAILRYEIEHPVVNDAEMEIWRRFGTQSWPTLAFVDPEGYFLGKASGELPRETLDKIVSQLVTYHRKKGTLDDTPVQFDLESQNLKETPLRFPGKLLADERQNRLFIADTSYNRIVVTSLEGELLDIIGNGSIGSADGSYNAASFDHPHGMTLIDNGNTLIVADTENHLLRVVDLLQKNVTTLAGTGKQSRVRSQGGLLRETALNSPWDVVALNDRLYIAMAGPHQIWQHELGSDTIEVYAGSGLEDIVDGTLGTSALAQPSAIVHDGQSLYFVDSEGSAVRTISASADLPRVKTIVGPVDLPGGRLFAFGDIDGIGTKVRLQHPIGLAINNDVLYVADTYNHKIKQVQLNDERGKTTGFLGTGERGAGLDPIQFSEPEGLTIANGWLFIADTNNHRIIRADLSTGKTSLFEPLGLTPPVVATASSDDMRSADNVEMIPVAPQTVANADALTIAVNLDFIDDYKLNALAPVSYQVEPLNQTGPMLVSPAIVGKRQKATIENGQAILQIPLAAETGAGSWQVLLRVAYCREGKGGLCKVKTIRWQLPVTVAASSTQKSIELTTGPLN